MTEKTVDLDQRRGMAAQKATDLRRLVADVEADQKAEGLAPSAGSGPPARDLFRPRRAVPAKNRAKFAMGEQRPVEHSRDYLSRLARMAEAGRQGYRIQENNSRALRNPKNTPLRGSHLETISFYGRSSLDAKQSFVVLSQLKRG
jgi:hypothetical protein